MRTAEDGDAHVDKVKFIAWYCHLMGPARFKLNSSVSVEVSLWEFPQGTFLPDDVRE